MKVFAANPVGDVAKYLSGDHTLCFLCPCTLNVVIVLLKHEINQLLPFADKVATFLSTIAEMTVYKVLHRHRHKQSCFCRILFERI